MANHQTAATPALPTIRYKASAISPPMKAVGIVFLGIPVLIVLLAIPMMVAEGRLGFEYLGLMAPGVAAFIVAFRRMRARLVVDRQQQTITLQRAGKNQVFSTAPAVWVDFQAAPKADMYRLVLVAGDGTWQALTDDYFYGVDHHRAVADQLRQLLGMSPENRPPG